MHKAFDSRLDQAWWALRIGLGVGPFLAGLDKFFNFLANWPAYISPLALILPFSTQNLHAHRWRDGDDRGTGDSDQVNSSRLVRCLSLADCSRYQSGLDRYVF